ncbi:reverse transcriptase domain-containing protein, partial [Vibrio cyclitrophicus]
MRLGNPFVAESIFALQRGGGWGVSHPTKGIPRGIPRGSSLSPLLAAFHLHGMDAYFAEQPGLYYARYMDDFILLTDTRWQLKAAVRRLNQFFHAFG